MKKIRLLFFCAFLLAFSTSCSVVKKNDPDKAILDFLSSFQTNLNKQDDQILGQFRVNQSREAILLVIAILQNKDPFIVCEADINNPKITRSSNLINLEIPALYRVKDLSSQDTVATTLRMTLTPQNETFLITQLDGEDFYQQFQLLRNQNEWEAQQQLALNDRVWIYENAKKLEPLFDSVIWYTSYNRETYFYVVKGEWKNLFLDYATRGEKNIYAKVGLCDASGQLIIPINYDLIGTIGFMEKDLVEVLKGDKVGYFNLKTKQEIVAPVYDFIIPYDQQGAWAVVKQDSIYGWLDRDYQFHNGFASENMEQWIRNFDYLKSSVRLDPNLYAFCEIPNSEYAGNGIIVPPSYLSYTGLFNQIEGGFSSSPVPMNGWTDYKESSNSFLLQLSENIRAVVTTIKERYLEGREEFYTSSTIRLVDNNNDLIGSSRISGEGAILRAVDSTLLEVKSPHDFWFMEEDASEESNLFNYEYFLIQGDKGIEKLHSRRLFAQTQFIKLDSSYLAGDFEVYNQTTEQKEIKGFLSSKTISYMVNEILASYGYTFPDTQNSERLKYLLDKDSPRYTALEEIDPLMSEIDRHNYRFLQKVLTLIQQPAL
jgi:hypothetical protein